MEEVAQEVNSLESFPAWCSVDTKIGAITVQLHELNCFDCEMYADEVELPKDYQVREDQRCKNNINTSRLLQRLICYPQ